MSATDILVAQKAYSTDLRYHERMARVVEGRGRLLIMLVAARFSEGRLWLPLMPLVYGLFCGPALNGRTK